MALHTVIWIDHSQARIFDFDAEGVQEIDVEAPQRHVRSRAAVSGRKEDSSGFFHDVAEKLHADHELLITGPSDAKLGLIKHIHAHHPGLVANIVGVETVDHPTDGQIVAYAKKYFRAADRLR
jgi:stalled ribosome rescue protein Dom34